MEIINQKIQSLNKYAVKIQPIMQLSQKTGQEPGLILGAFLLLIGLIILITMGATILTVVITVVYPAIKSIKALESKDDSEDDKMWLTYWCVFGIFTLLDEFCGFIFSYIPFYYYIKLLFFVWMMAPQTKGAELVYHKVLKPILHQHKDKIEKMIAEVKGGSMNIASDLTKAAMD